MTFSLLSNYPEFMERPATPIERAFVAFHKANPKVYSELEQLALTFHREQPGMHMGIAMLYETMRYNLSIRTTGDPFKLNNNYRALYARLLIFRNPALTGRIELRERREEG